MKNSALLLTLLFAGCATSSGFQSYYVGNGNLQWFVSPIAFEHQGGDSAVVDFTYRRIQGQSNKVRVNITWNYSQVPQGVQTVEFTQPEKPPRLLTEIEVLFQEKSSHSIRFSGLLEESDFLDLVSHPHSALTIVSGMTTRTFRSSPMLEQTFHALGEELQ